jgi:hypothetical protein
MEIVAKKGGDCSIQINSLQALLNDSRFSSCKSFINTFPDVELIGRKNNLSNDFKIFIIMDTDDCTASRKNEYITKALFKNHWAYDYIVPIFDTPDLEHVMEKAGIKFTKKD